MEKTNETNIGVTVGLFLVLGFILVPIGIVGWQIYEYLRHDIWNSLSVVSALQWGGVKWANAPTDWVGLHRILDWMPLSLALVAIGILILVGLNTD